MNKDTSIKMETPDLPEDIIARFDAGEDLAMMHSLNDNLLIGDNEDNEPDDIIILHMDIREPLRTLRTLLELKIGVSLKDYEFWLQDTQTLEPHKNLVDQCVEGEGLVQINAQVQTIDKRINIVDVLKPTEAALAALGNSNTDSDSSKKMELSDDKKKFYKEDQKKQSTVTTPSSTIDDENTVTSNPESICDENSSDKYDHVINWILDGKFKKDQIRLKIPDDPIEWTCAQVKHWLQWAVRQFSLTQIKLSDWNINGKELCELTPEEYQHKVPNDPGNAFWTHLELLRRCKFIAVIQKLSEEESDDTPIILKKSPKIIKKSMSTVLKQYGNSSNSNLFHYETSNRTGNNGQIQLWQFLLDILTDKDHCYIIQWIGSDGEFKLMDPERVAQLWGERKNKPTMNYEKLSRALRYYYDGDMIAKVHGKRFVYRFVCDLKQLIGYNADELSALVNASGSSQSTDVVTDFIVE